MWDEILNFEDNIGLLVLQMITPHDLRWDKDGTGAGDGVDPQKVQGKYGSTAESGSGVDPHMHDLRWDIDGTGAKDRVDPKLRSECYNPTMDLKLDLKLTLPKTDLTLVSIWW